MGVRKSVKALREEFPTLSNKDRMLLRRITRGGYRYAQYQRLKDKSKAKYIKGGQRWQEPKKAA